MWQPFNVSLICWHPQGAEWRPYPDDEPILEIAEQVTSNRRLACREFMAGPKLLERLQQCRRDGDAVIVVTSPEALQSAQDAALWQEFDRQAPYGVGLIVAWDGQGMDPAQAASAVRAALPNLASTEASRHDEVLTVTSSKTLREKMEIVIERMLSVARSEVQPSRKAENSALERSAEAEGIAPQSLPGLTGPGSST